MIQGTAFAACALALLSFSNMAVPALAEVPIEIAPSGHATVPVEGSFGTKNFVIDTGAEGSAVYEDFATSVGLVVSGTLDLQGQTGTSEVPLVNLGELVIDGKRGGPIEAVKLARRNDGVPLAGIIGIDFFGDSTLDFDLPRKRVSLHASEIRPDGLTVAPLYATATTGGLLTVPVQIGSATAVAVIDTGARKTRINWALGRLLGLDPATLAAGETIYGATNAPVETGATQIANVRFGSAFLAEAPVLVSDLPVFGAFGVADKPAVILGLDWLMSVRMVINFPARSVWFEPAS